MRGLTFQLLLIGKALLGVSGLTGSILAEPIRAITSGWLTSHELRRPAKERQRTGLALAENSNGSLGLTALAYSYNATL